ncbi:hypothetical protein C84B14_15743 [Salinisphaera sp. C84B14]|uniref:hypothetical protein n=1 Tax=Salinisphaera sp. C84B14 TaxID=1304155 RepID=UPI0033412C21
MIEPHTRLGRTLRYSWVLLLVLACTAASAAAKTGSDASEQRDFSQANRLLFMTDHLNDVQTPATLAYAFAHREHEDSERDYDDRVLLNIDSSDQAGKHVAIDFLSDERHRYMPEVDNARGNPVIMMFLQNDVSTLAQQTGGSWRYFQRRVKFALQDSASVTEDIADYRGEQVAVQRIELEPYADERGHREKMADAVKRHYTFVLSDAVPGGVLELRASTPAGDGRGETLDRMTLLPPDSHTPNTP